MATTTYCVVASFSTEFSPNTNTLFTSNAATRVMYIDAAQLTTSFTARCGYSSSSASAYTDSYVVGVAVFNT